MFDFALNHHKGEKKLFDKQMKIKQNIKELISVVICLNLNNRIFFTKLLLFVLFIYEDVYLVEGTLGSKQLADIHMHPLVFNF